MRIVVDKLPVFPKECHFSSIAHGQSVCDIDKDHRLKNICNVRTCTKLITLNEVLHQQN